MKSVKIAIGMGISERYLRRLCEQGRVHGAVLVGKTWILPDIVIIYKARRGGKATKIHMVEAHPPPDILFQNFKRAVLKLPTAVPAL